jgi:hypothetical protein
LSGAADEVKNEIVLDRRATATAEAAWRLWFMIDAQDLSLEERNLLRAALDGPLHDRDPALVGLCLRLCGRRLLQRAGLTAQANGWRGSPHAFVLTRQGWAFLKAERRGRPMLRAG